MTQVCVIGAGIVGCATAYALARQGLNVTLIDRAAQPGLGTSFANGAQLSYSYVEPFASPATLRGLPKMLLSRGSAVPTRCQPAASSRDPSTSSVPAYCTVRGWPAERRRSSRAAGSVRQSSRHHPSIVPDTIGGSVR